MKKILYLLVGLSWYYCPLINAASKQNFYSTGLGSPITTTVADTMGKGEWGISARSEYYPNTPFPDIELINDPWAEKQSDYLINYLMIYYGLSSNLTVGVNLPYTYTSNVQAANPVSTNINYSDRIAGISDTNFYYMWTLTGDKAPESIAVLGGINAPTGTTSIRDKSGFLFSAADQPGSGAWTPFSGLAFTKKWDKLQISSDLFYTQATEGAQRYTIGSTFYYDFAAVFELYQAKGTNLQLDGILELNGGYAFQDTMAGTVDPDSGGNTIYLSPGFRANINEKISLYLGFGIPVVQNLYGSQDKIKYNGIAGIDISI